jgi:hypothetical protein
MRLWLALASVAIWVLFLSLIVGFFTILVSFFTDKGGVGSNNSSGYRYNFQEHQNYWNEDK